MPKEDGASISDASLTVPDAGDAGPPATEATKREGIGGRTAKRSEPDGALSRGAIVGRYTILEQIGAGGMGVVYAAYDPELDRRVAIKLLQDTPATASGGNEQGWLVREAQALARLSHPNVVAVHDVGTLPGDRVFIAIELVHGRTLRKWVGEPRSWSDVRTVMREAGAGLAAIHAAGLVHRDFKPDNVLVGDDGRVRVMDLGLAHLDGDSHDDYVGSTASESASGSVIGTPAYMAPELFEGAPASARSDEFAFGVTLYEVLFHQRPYDKNALKPPRAADLAPKLPPRSAGVPSALSRIALRAVAVRPTDRFGSLAELLEALAIDPLRGRRRALLGVGIAAMGAALAVGGFTLQTRARDDVRLCKDADRRLNGVWDASAKSAVAAAFAKTSRPFRGRAAQTFTATLDSYATAWTTAATESCEATRLRGEQTEEVLSLRDDCLEQRLRVMRSLVGLMRDADDQVVDRAATTAANFANEESPARCADVAALKAPTQPTAALRPTIDKLAVRLADARAGLIAGNAGRAMNAAEEVAAGADAIHFEPLVAEAKLTNGLALLLVGNLDDAATSFAAATWAALRGHHDDIAAMAALHAAFALDEGQHKAEQAQLFIELAKATTTRTSNLANELEIKRYQLEGIVAGNRGDLIAATKSHEAALALAIRIYGRDNVVTAQSEQLVAATAARSGNFMTAKPRYLRALELVRAMVGPDHPEVALLETGLATCNHKLGDDDAAIAQFTHSLAIRERLAGPDSPVLVPTLNNFAELYRDRNEPERGLPLSERARQISKRLGKMHPYYTITEATHGELLMIANRHQQARPLLDDAVQLADRFKSPYLAGTLSARAVLARHDKQWNEAAALDERAIALIEKQIGSTTSELVRPLTGLALARIEQRRADDARTLLARALAIGETAHLAPNLLAPIRTALAKLPSR